MKSSKRSGSMVNHPIVLNPKLHTHQTCLGHLNKLKQTYCKIGAYVRVMGFSWPVSFTHVYLLIWLWLCKDNGGDFGGDTNRYIAKYMLKAWTECRCFGGGDSVIPCHLFHRRWSSRVRLKARA